MQRDIGIHMKGGVITERDPEYCTVRLRAPAGIFTVDQIRGIAVLAKRYGNSEVHSTTRQTLEIPHVKGIGGGAPQGVESAVQLDTTPRNLPGATAE